jgi:glutamine synthetase
MNGDRTEFRGADVRAAIDEQSVAEWLASLGAEAVHLGIFDASGTLREKRLSPSSAERAFERGWSFIDAIDWWAPDDTTFRDDGSVDRPAKVDVNSGRWHPFEDSGLLFLADFGPPLDDISPRLLLQRIVERAQSIGIRAEVGWEFECIVLDGWDSVAEAGPMRPGFVDNVCWSASTMAAGADLFSDLTQVLQRGGIAIDHMCAELGPGCLELATAPMPALRSADDAALMKVFTKAFFSRRGQRATFMAQLSEEFPGLGGHPSLSLHSTLTGEPLLAEEAGELSKLAGSAIAGVLTLLPDLMAMVAPNPNSYRRFAPGNWAPSTATWGPGNYSCALRSVAGKPQDTRLELRIPGADTVPHLCLAMFLGAAIWGIEADLEPPSPVVAPADGRHLKAAAPLPRDLVDATQQLRQSRPAADLFGPAFVEHFCAARLAEAEVCRRFVPRHEQLRYLHTV